GVGVPGARPPDLRALPRDPARRLRDRAGAPHARCRLPERLARLRRLRGAYGPRLRLAPAGHPPDDSGLARPQAAGPQPPPLPRSPRRSLADALQPRPLPDRPEWGRRGRSARAGAARAARPPAAVERARARRDARRARTRAVAARVPPLLRRCLA